MAIEGIMGGAARGAGVPQTSPGRWHLVPTRDDSACFYGEKEMAQPGRPMGLEGSKRPRPVWNPVLSLSLPHGPSGS